jgi:hypothetical protein
MTLGWLNPSIRFWALPKRRDEQQKRIFLGACAFGRERSATRCITRAPRMTEHALCAKVMREPIRAGKPYRMVLLVGI